MIPRRFTIARKWARDRLRGRAGHVPLREMLGFMCQGREGRRGLKFIVQMRDEGEWVAVSLRGYEGTLYWPKDDPLGALSLILDEQLGRDKWHAYVTPETPLGSDEVVVDCGASEGLFSFLHQEACRRIILVEPNPIYVKALEKTFAGNRKVTIAPVALGSVSGQVKFSLRGVASKVSEEGEYPVAIRRLDDLLEELNSPASFIKADLEGFELDFLEGARATIARHHPKIAITTYHHPDHPRRIAEFLRCICPDYEVRLKGYTAGSEAIMLHAWVPR
jgi:FkbM family methyltransferase